MARQGATVKRNAAFDAMVVEIAETHPGVQAAVKDFIEALRIGGADLPAQRVGANQYVHLLDDVSRGSAGKSRFGVTYYQTGASPLTFEPKDIWVRDY